MERIPVEFPAESGLRSYTVLVGQGILGEAGAVAASLNPSRVCVIAHPLVPGVEAITQRITTCSVTTHQRSIPEHEKNIQMVNDLWELFQREQLDRKSVIISVGGGALSDTVGFAASTFMRGIPLIHCPTTLLSQADAAVGGKTGINAAHVKNLVGTFAQPVCVVVDVATLTTLPQRELLSGYAEIIKHACIDGRASLANIGSVTLPALLAETIGVKARIVAKDPFERLGLRKLLNFGHTFGHAIESVSHRMGGSHILLHGEAISLGILAEAHLSVTQFGAPPSLLNELRESLKKVELPLNLSVDFPKEDILAALLTDKKNERGQIKWTLLRDIGKAESDIVVDDELAVHGALDYLYNNTH